MNGTMPEPCTSWLAWKLDKCFQTSDNCYVIRKTSQMLNLNVKLLEHFIGELKKFREKCGRLQRKTSIASFPNSALTLNVTHFALVCAQLLSDRLEDPHFMLGLII